MVSKQASWQPSKSMWCGHGAIGGRALEGEGIGGRTEAWKSLVRAMEPTWPRGLQQVRPCPQSTRHP